MLSTILTEFASQIVRPDPRLLYQRNDPNDVRMGEWVQTDPSTYSNASVVLLGCPQDEGVQRNGGRIGAAGAPNEIRRALYRLGVAGLEDVCLFDLGDTQIQPTLEATHTLHQQIVRQVLTDGKRLIVLGGGNDISYPDCAGTAQAAGAPLAFNIDAHFDVRADTPRNSGTPYRQLLDEHILAPDQFALIGTQRFANSATYVRYLNEQGAQIHWADDLGDLRAVAQAHIAQHPSAPLFWGFDMDVVRIADAPGVSAPNPLGISGAAFCQLAAFAGSQPHTRLIEISEVNPTYDIDQRTCRLAAVAIWHALHAFAQIGAVL